MGRIEKRVLRCITKRQKTSKITNRNHFPATACRPYYSDEKSWFFGGESVEECHRFCFYVYGVDFGTRTPNVYAIGQEKVAIGQEAC
jgi:hypothetical protein